MLQGYTVSAHI